MGMDQQQEGGLKDSLRTLLSALFSFRDFPWGGLVIWGGRGGSVVKNNRTSYEEGGLSCLGGVGIKKGRLFLGGSKLV